MSEAMFWRMEAERRERGGSVNEYRPAPDGYPDMAVIETACPRCGAPAGFLCDAQRGYLIHRERSAAWREGRPVPGGPPMREGNNPRTGIAWNE